MIEILLRAHVSKARGDRDQFSAALQLGLAEPPGEEAPDGGNEGRPSGEEDAIDGAGRNARRLEQRLNAILDCLQIVFDPRFEFGTSDWNAQVDGGWN